MTNKLPDGWVNIIWKDSQEKKWNAVVPSCMRAEIVGNIILSNGYVVKLEK